MKIAVLPGHYPQRPGAINKDLNIKEHDAALIVALLTFYFLHQSDRKVPCEILLQKRIRDKIAMANAAGAEIVVEIHFNSFKNPQANGAEVLYISKEGKKLAQYLLKEILKITGGKDRGVKTDIEARNAKLPMLRKTRGVCCLTESLFISNLQEAKKLLNPAFLVALGKAHSAGILKYIKGRSG